MMEIIARAAVEQKQAACAHGVNRAQDGSDVAGVLRGNEGDEPRRVISDQ